ncbi:MAG TPA: ATPase, T2SS/T4P/T4SS family [Stellaceae bacterium]|nr:ATPase, T2SS/T4P/T4SS family [Stellaceae bacterium]
MGINRDDKATGAERRRRPRNRTFWNGQLHTPHGRFDCRVVDMSSGGAQVRLARQPDGPVVPVFGKEPVTLVITRLGRFTGSVAWQRERALGLHLTRHQGAGDSVPAASAERAGPVQSAPPPEQWAEIQRVFATNLPGAADAAPVTAVRPRDATSKAERERIDGAVAAIHPLIMEAIRPEVAVRMPEAQFEREIAALVADIALQNKVALSGPEQAQVCRRIVAEMIGFGPIEPLLADETVSDILVNGPRQVYIERYGKLELSDVTFGDDQHVLNVAARIVNRAGRRIDESTPLVDARLPDGSRINVIIPPLAVRGPMMSIRKFAKREITLDIMAQQQSMSPAMAALLKIAGRCRLNILISGGTGAGKTTLLNAISQTIDPTERIITIEDAAELQLPLPHVASLETRPPNLESKNEITMRDLLKNALRMRPDRIILGEVRGAEAFDMLQAMNTGHDGSLGTIHASGPREALTRLENIVTMSGYDLPVRFIRAQIASAIHLIVQVARMRDGKRRITSITEIAGLDGDIIATQELFTYRLDGEGPGGELVGTFASSGLRPRFHEKAEYYGLGQTLATVTRPLASAEFAIR